LRQCGTDKQLVRDNGIGRGENIALPAHCKYVVEGSYWRQMAIGAEKSIYLVAVSAKLAYDDGACVHLRIQLSS
jgi:hypothetical protein